MENASKALIMAGSILLGVMILTIAVYLFSTYAQYSSDTYAEIEKTQITEFNAQFLKYYGNTAYSYTDELGREKIVEEPIKCTAHDIITVANLAQQNNKYYELDNTDQDNNSYYIVVDVKVGSRNLKNAEEWDNNDKIDFIKEYSNREFKVTKCDINEVTKRVKYMKFDEK